MGFGVSLTGLQGAQKAMDSVQQNIANVNTPDYKKLDALFTAMDFSGPNNVPFNPGGVKTDIITSGDPFTDNRVNAAKGQAAYDAAFTSGLQQLNDGVKTAPVEKAFSEFMNATQDLQTNPQDPVKQTAWKNTGQAFSTALQALGDQFTAVSSNIQNQVSLKQIELKNLQASMSQLTAGPNTPESQSKLNTMQQQVLMLTNSIAGYQKVISGVIPPIYSMYTNAAEQAVLGSNESYGQVILDVNGGFKFDPNNMGNVKALTEFGNQLFNQQMGVMNTEMGSQLNSEKNVNDAAQAALATALSDQKAVSGVDLAEQAVKMVQYQNMYNANAKAIQVQNEMLGTLLNIKA